MSTPLLPDILTTEQAAELLQLKPQTVSIMASQGRLPAKKLGRDWRYSRERLIAFIRGDWSPPVKQEKRGRGRPKKPWPSFVTEERGKNGVVH